MRPGGQQQRQFLTHARQTPRYLAGRGGGLPALVRQRAIDRHHSVEVAPVRNRVMHHMRAGADPQRHAIGLDLRRHALKRHQAAIEGHAAGRWRHLARHSGAQRRADAVGRDHARAFREGAVGEIEACGLAAVVEAADAPAGVEFDGEIAPGGGDQARQQVCPVADAVGSAETLLEGLAQPDALQERARPAVTHVDLGRDDASRLDRLPRAQRLQRAHPVGRHLQPCTNLLEGWRLLEQAHGHALPCQPQGCRQSADAAAGNEHGVVVHGMAF